MKVEDDVVQRQDARHDQGPDRPARKGPALDDVRGHPRHDQARQDEHHDPSDIAEPDGVLDEQGLGQAGGNDLLLLVVGRSLLATGQDVGGGIPNIRAKLTHGKPSSGLQRCSVRDAGLHRLEHSGPGTSIAVHA